MKKLICLLCGMFLVCAVRPAAAGEEKSAKPVSGNGVSVKYEPNWESLDSRPTPKWFTDAKFGIFIHWGVYSVPAWGPKGEFAENYAHWLYRAKRRDELDFHKRVYGKDFKYEQFAPMFKAELFDPDEWAEVFKQAGARYVVLTSKHTDSYCLWPAPDSQRWNSVEVGPKRDLCGDLTKAVRAKGLKMGFYYCLLEWYNPYSTLYQEDVHKYVENRMLPQLKDLVMRYKPSVVWADGEWDHPYTMWRSTEFLEWLFNEGPNPHEVAINDRWDKGSRHKHGGYYTTEYGAGLKDASHPWEECRGIAHSFGYSRNESLSDYRTARELILMLIDIVSRGGNLLLDIGPTADGRIPVIMEERLIQIGEWLKVNGEAIYGTMPWRKSCQWSKGQLPQIDIGKQYMAEYDIDEMTGKPNSGKAVVEAFFTSEGDSLYAIMPRWPKKQFILKGATGSRNTVVTMFGLKEPLKFETVGGNIVVEVPQLSVDEVPCKYAYVLKLTGVE